MLPTRETDLYILERDRLNTYHNEMRPRHIKFSFLSGGHLIMKAFTRCKQISDNFNKGFPKLLTASATAVFKLYIRFT